MKPGLPSYFFIKFSPSLALVEDGIPIQHPLADCMRRKFISMMRKCLDTFLSRPEAYSELVLNARVLFDLMERTGFQCYVLVMSDA